MNTWYARISAFAQQENRPCPPANAPEMKAVDAAVSAGKLEDDNFLSLAILPDFSPLKIMLFQAYSRYLAQVVPSVSLSDCEKVLVKYAEAAQILFNFFEARFMLKQKKGEERKAYNSFKKEMEKLSSKRDRLLLKRLFNLIEATVRTNFYQKKEKEMEYLSFKINSSLVVDMPLPVPMTEIFVYSARTEAIHLRFGKVARGGIRWSDRPADYRTEVLGLVKAQQVKNVVIVPVGSKGGFILKKDVSKLSFEERQKEATACYTIMANGMLDITDNLVKGKTVPPKNVVRHDGDDPYLVVAADKGTAGFSDLANQISADYKFWLGDAFASGGSNGYHHKGMGITSNGLWKSVLHHFKKLGRNPQKEAFTAAGVGCMSGDVFGNTALMSPQMLLKAVFSHSHIFLDPTPDPKTSFAERKRLFDLSKITWQDYNPALLSKGGMIISKAEKEVTLTKEAAAMLGFKKPVVTPAEIMPAILKMPVDLLFFGGIGTFVKSERETHGDVKDKANDQIRINGSDIKAKIVGEGANLGMTQKGRIEYALNGGILNTDAVDNSGGVDCSDHEVNLKIFFQGLVAKKKITLTERNKLLKDMTSDVARLVLQDNYLQNIALSISQIDPSPELEEDLMEQLESLEGLDRALESLPSTKEIKERYKKGSALTRPELCVLLAYTKMRLFDVVLNSFLPEDETLEKDFLPSYFPELIQKKFYDAIFSHPLKREILAMTVSNLLVNRMGITFISHIYSQEKAKVKSDRIVMTWLAAYRAMKAEKIFEDIKALDSKSEVSAESQLSLLKDVARKLESLTNAFLKQKAKDILSLSVLIERSLKKDKNEELVRKYADNGIPASLLNRIF